MASLLCLALLAACAPWPQRAGIPTRWAPSPNFDARRVNFVVVHYTSNDSMAEALRTMTDREAKVSAHYLIDRDGSILQLVDERARAWHAGDSRWGATTDLNSSSIGIELDNNGREPYPKAQVDALLRLLADLQRRHRFPGTNVIGHSDVAPVRKIDPGPLFPWPVLAAHGFGLWCEPPVAPVSPAASMAIVAPASAAPALPGVSAMPLADQALLTPLSPPLPPPLFDPLLGLRVIGYDTRRPDAAIAAFRLHYLPALPMDAPVARDSALIQCLAEKARAQ